MTSVATAMLVDLSIETASVASMQSSLATQAVVDPLTEMASVASMQSR